MDGHLAGPHAGERSCAGSLDPAEWRALRILGHQMLDDLFDDLEAVREGPVWQPMPDDIRAAWQAPLPHSGADPVDVYADYRRLVAPYGVGNRHPRFFGWVHGGGTVIGMLAEMLAAGLNANCGGRDHAPIEVERQVVRWAAEMLGFPKEAGGLVLSGTSMANFVAVLAARWAALGGAVREDGIGGTRLMAYASDGAHMCVARALDMAGLGSRSLRLIACDDAGRMRIPDLAERLEADRAAGMTPFMVVGTAGSVDIGAIDDLAGLAEMCRENGLWFHVDAAFGAMAMLSDRLQPLLRGIEQADSVVFDFHKWMQVPYAAGCIVVRDQAVLRAAFVRQADYLRPTGRGLTAGEPWPVDLGPELSRGFRALKVWMTIRTYGADRLRAVVEHCCVLAQRLAATIARTPELELVAPVALNIVCLRVAGGDDATHDGIASWLQETGRSVLSTTTLGGRRVLRAAIVNHRTRASDVDAIVSDVLDARNVFVVMPRR
ncbi:pyridoxal phosphate-dependent decarboxylase family protein [Rhodopila globiformis]|uniref:Cytochrome D ubiquinol oxidase subunit I n=1 Tax=Rhodopila globiformis TaxID=1071 RepID=A0A2S6NHS0_RHOGL|nr:pyridoxal-dependent decarboxylase [Rhodopila globiformis]PPQ34176.1 cytochrome D ubiquinol oxidase subunit I [Rhodopila globiformis]